MIYLLDADLSGTDSIAHLIESGAVIHLPCDTFGAYDKHVRDLINKVGPDDLVILDTLTKLADTARGDMKLGTNPAEELWDKRHIYFSDKNYLTVYEAAGQMIMRRLRNLRARNARVITTCHEDEQVDPATMSNKRAPAVNQALYRSLMGSSSDSFRLYLTSEDLADNEGKIILPVYSHVLQLRPNNEALTKFHVTPDVSPKVPKNLVNPTLPRLYKALGKRPAWLNIYGQPGAGKTTLATSEQTQEKTNNK